MARLVTQALLWRSISRLPGRVYGQACDLNGIQLQQEDKPLSCWADVAGNALVAVRDA